MTAKWRNQSFEALLNQSKIEIRAKLERLATIDTEKLDDCRVVWISIYLHSRIRTLRHTTSSIWPCQASNVKLWRAKQSWNLSQLYNHTLHELFSGYGRFWARGGEISPPMQLFYWLQPIALGQPYLQKSKMSEVCGARFCVWCLMVNR